MLKGSVPVAYPVHNRVLNRYAVYQRGLVKNENTLVGFLLAKMVTCKERALSSAGGSECAHY